MKDVGGMKSDEALKVVLDAWDQAVKTRAPELKIIVGSSKRRTKLKSEITKSLEDK